MTTDLIVRRKLVHDYWATKLTNKNKAIHLSAHSFAHRASLAVPVADLAVTRLLAMTKGSSWSMLTIAATLYQVLLSRYYPDGGPLLVAPNTQGDADDVLFYHTDPVPGATLRTCVGRMKEDIQQSQRHADIDMMSLRQIAQEGGMETDSLFQFGLMINSFHSAVALTDRCSLLLSIQVDTDQVSLRWQYDTSAFSPAFVQQFANQYLILLDTLMAGADALVADINLLSAAEITRLRTEWNATNTPLDPALTVVVRFEEQTNETPDAVALVFGQDVLTYTQLNNRVNQLTYSLIENGVRPGDLVGVCLDRSSWSVTAILAILKAGGVYLHLDKHQPVARRTTIVQAAKPVLVITETGSIAALEGLTIPTLRIDAIAQSTGFVANPTVTLRQDDASYCIFTSGSTGEPKGVMQTHRTLINLMEWQRNHSGITAGERYLQYASFGFDVSLQDVCFCLCYGGSLHVLPEADKHSIRAIQTYILTHQIQTLYMPGSVLNNLFDADLGVDFTGHALTQMITAGEQLLIGSHLAHFLTENPTINLHNHYGPSETHVVTACTVSGNQPIVTKTPIGKPVANTQVYVLNEHYQLVPVGMNGDVFIGGFNLAQGYLGRPDWTSERFFMHTWPDGVTERLYRTGDLARWQPDGTLEYIGRKDHQVKIRGFRIELAEIEQAILKYEDVREVVVLVNQSDEAANTDKFLVAYYTASQTIDSAQLRTYLSSVLPEYMVPAHFMQLERFPLNVNGKVDRNVLPNPAMADAEVITDEPQLPRTTTEAEVAAIWADILGKTSVGVTDDFFRIGGHSLKATRMIARIYKQFGVEVGIKDFFATPTVASLANFVDRTTTRAVVDIPVAPIAATYPLSHAQYRFWLQEQNTGQQQYNLPFAFRLDGEVDSAAVAHAFQALIERHEILRTRIVTVDGQPRQQVIPAIEADYQWQVLDWRTLPDREARIADMASAQASQPFDLSQAPLLRVSLVRAGERDYVLMMIIHHIVCDGWSIDVFTNELFGFYEAYRKGMSKTMEPLRIQYKDFSVWQNDCFQQPSFAAHEQYWHNQFADGGPVLELATDFVRPPMRQFAGESVQVTLDETLSQTLTDMANAQGVSMYMLVLAAFKTLLFRYTSQTDLVVGSPVASREHADLHGQIGNYINTLAIRTAFSGNDSFADLLVTIKAGMLDAYTHQMYPFDKLVEHLDTGKDLSRTPVFSAGFNWHNYAAGQAAPDWGFTVALYDAGLRVSRSDIWLHGSMQENGQITLSFDYDVALFAPARINRMLTHFTSILRHVGADSQQPLSTIAYLDPTEKQQLLDWSEGTSTLKPPTTNLVSLVGRAVQTYGQQIALTDGEDAWSYATLWQRSNQVANCLMTQTVNPEEPIGILLPRRVWMLAGVLGVLKAGGCYVPLDRTYPTDRLQYIIGDAGIRQVLVEEAGMAQSLGLTGVTEVVLSAQTMVSVSEAEVATNILPAQLAYILYTSGSTGQPKGVQIEHRNSVAFLTWCLAEFADVDYDLAPATTSLNFDLSVYELFYPLLAGKPIRILESGLSLIDYLPSVTDQKLLLNSVPSVIDALLKANVSLQAVSALTMCGEPIGAYTRQHLPFDQMMVWNLYGPTEDTTYSTGYRVTDGRLANRIGRSKAFSQAYVLSEDNQLQPIGVPGEICLSGAGVARGYHNKPELSRERFAAHPFNSGTVLYRTGDLGYWDETGQMVCLGRKDNQVKIRGYRIDLGEIESVLQQHEQVEQAVVLVDETDGDKRLVAYVVGQPHCNITELRQYVSRKLPPHIIPQRWELIDRLPLTLNGKIDRRTLLTIRSEQATAVITHEAPQDDIEQGIANAWTDVLGLTDPDVNENFFDAGGHSLKAARLTQQIWQQLALKVDLTDVYQFPTIRGLASQIRNRQVQAYETIPVIATGVAYAVSPAQRRMWMLQQMEPENYAYNMAFAYELAGPLNETLFAEAWNWLVDRHESLRTIFAQQEGTVVQIIQTPDQHKFAVSWLPANTLTTAAIRQWVEQDSKHVFDLANGPLLRVTVLQAPAERNIISLVMHHIVSDGWSMGVMFGELFGYYNARLNGQPAGLSPLRIQYKDVAAWQIDRMASETMQQHKQYWLDQFAGELPLLNLPADAKRGAIKHHEGHSQGIEIDSATMQLVTALARREGVSDYMIYLTALNLLLHRYTGEQDFVVGCAIAGREHADLEQQVGVFVNTIALRTSFDPNQTVEELLQKIKTNTLGGYEHQAYPFEELVEALSLAHDMSRPTLFNVMLTLQNVAENIETLTLDGVQVQRFGGEAESSKFDWDINIRQLGDTTVLAVNYDKSLFSPERMQRMLQHFQVVLRAVVEQSETPIATVSCLSPAEKTQLLGWSAGETLPLPITDTLVSLVSRAVQTFDGQVAITDEQHAWSYNTLWQQANRVAHALVAQGVTPEEPIGILLPRQVWMLAGLLGVLKAGGCYVPLDRAYPPDRLQHIINDAGIRRVLVEQSGMAATLGLTGLEEVVLSEQTLTHFSTSDVAIGMDPRQLAYVLYTSGSTGQPKGVQLEHRNAVAFLHWCLTEFADADYDLALAVTSLNFDLSVYELFYPLLAGKPIHILESGLSLVDYLPTVTEQKLLVNTVPSVVDALLKSNVSLQSVSVLNMAGEPIGAYIRQHLPFDQMAVRNLYGPTEDTTYSTGYRVRDGHLANRIGRSKQGSQAYVLGAGDQLQPIGVVGEICLTGAGVARGYYNQPVLSRERFGIDPFGSAGAMYRTGDLGYWDEAGELVCMGRKDTQIKLRGYRIELGEIEKKLEAHADIKQAVLVVQGGGENQRLVAYYEGLQGEVDHLGGYLGSKLPSWMVPDAFVCLAEFPLTPNGKIDRRTLSERVTVTISAASEAVITEAEAQLKAVWEDELGLSGIGRHDNFFRIGGHSLKAVRLVQQINKQLNQSLHLWEVFRYPTLAAMAERLDNQQQPVYHPIPTVGEKAYFAVSSSQKRMWLLQQLEPTSYVYNMAYAWDVTGPMNEDAFEKAWEALVERHEVLRTVLIEANAELHQKILTRPQSGFAVEWTSATDETALEAAVTALSKHIFDLAQGPLLRVRVWRVTPERRVVMLVMHHIISDGWSMGVLEKDVFGVYNTLRTGQASALSPLRIQYKDFSDWQQQNLLGDAMTEHRQYWLEQLGGTLPQMSLPSEETYDPAQPTDSARQVIEIDAEVIQRIQELARQESLSDYMVFLAALNVLLYRYTGDADQLVGCAVAGRDQADLDDQLGNYVNTLALRTQLDADWNVGQLLDHVRRVLIDGYAHQSYPFDTLIEELGIDRNVSQTSFFNVMLSLQKASIAQTSELDGLTVAPYGKAAASNKFDWDIDIQGIGDKWVLMIGYDRNRFSDARIGRMLNHYQTILQSFAQDQTRSIAAVHYLKPAEETQLRAWSTCEPLPLPITDTLVSLVSRAVQTFDGQVAITDEQHAWSYNTLWQQANRVAHALVAQGVTPEEPIGILLPRQVWMLAGLLGVLKAGGCYVPLDRAYPPDRLQHIINDAGIRRVLVEQADMAQALGLTGVTEVILSEETLATFSDDEPALTLDARQLAYVLYTSGSTGQPKGVQLEHRNAVAFLHWCLTEFADADYDLALAVTSLNFDLSVYELFYPLLAGKPIHILESGLSLVDYLPTVTEQKLLVNTVPSVVDALLKSNVSLQSVSVLNMAGEPIGAYIRQHLPFDQMAVRNLYGPTEDTTYSTGYRVRDGHLANRIGRSKQGSQAYVLGAGDQLQPIGVVGEICLTGAGVARGYYNQPVLSRERFGIDPFGSAGAMYRTGDLGYWDEAGELVCMGRKDTQIKLRGYRIELGEIEKKLEAHADIKQAVLVVQGGGENQRLVAYYEGLQGEVDHLGGYLGSKLPSWMVPDAFVCLAEFPLTPNGKIDRRTLSERVTVTISAASEAVITEAEAQLKAVWEDELGLSGIGRHDNFFRIGGHSLKAVRLISRIREAWQIDLPLKIVFLYPTIAQLAGVLSSSETTSALLPTLDHQEEYEVSPGQLVWLTKYRYALERVAFNMQAQSTLLNLNLDAFNDSIEVLIDRHESLRSRFVWQGNRFVQRITDTTSFDFKPTYIDVRQAADVFTAVRELTKQRIDQPFDCETGPLFAIQLYRLTDHDYRVAFIIDHVISDAWSLKTLQAEFTQLYDAFYQSETNPLKPLQRQYKDFSAWHRTQLLSDAESKSQAYWRQKLASVEWGRDLSHALADDGLQREHSYARYIDAELDRYFKTLDAEQRQQVHGSVFSVRPLRGLSYQTIVPETVLTPLKQLAQETNASLFSVLSASLALLVHSHTGRKDVLIGTPVSLRGHQDFDALVGWFLDTLLLHNPVDPSSTVREVVQLANLNNAEAHEHRYYPFERVLQDSDVSLDAIGSVFMHLLNGEEHFTDDGFVSTHHPAGSPTFDINFTFNEYKNCLMLTCDYRDEVFSPASIERVTQAYLTILERMGAATDCRVTDIIPLISLTPQLA